MTLAGLKGMSVSKDWFFTQSRIFSTSADCTLYSSQFLTALSSRIRIEYGRFSLVQSESLMSLTKSFVSEGWEIVVVVFAHSLLYFVEWIGLWTSSKRTSEAHKRELVFL